MPLREYQEKEIIAREGEEAVAAYIIRSGKVDIYKKASHGDIHLATLGEGETFGEMALFGDRMRSASIRAVEPTVLEEVRVEVFDKMLNDCPPLLMPIIHSMVARLRKTNERLTQKEQGTVLLNTDFEKIEIVTNTPEMEACFEKTEIPVAQLPYRIGGYLQDTSPNQGDRNHVYIPSPKAPLNVSRNHAVIALYELEEEQNKGKSGLFFVDRGSRFGSTVNGQRLGRGRGLYRVPLQKGENEIQLGKPDSTAQFVVRCV